MLFCSHNCCSPLWLIIFHSLINSWFFYFFNNWLIRHLSIFSFRIYIFWCFYTFFVIMYFSIVYFMRCLLLIFNFFISFLKYIFQPIFQKNCLRITWNLRYVLILKQIFFDRFLLFILKISFSFLLFKYIFILILIDCIIFLLLIS